MTRLPKISMPMTPTGPCWICGADSFHHVWTDPFDLTAHPRYGPYAHNENPPSRLLSCRSCGFAQPESLPGIPDYFDLMYGDQPWLNKESMAIDYNRGAKDLLFREVLSVIGKRLAPDVPRTVLDVGTYIGRFLELATNAGFDAEGIELNLRAADFAERRTGRPIHRVKAQELADSGRRYGAVTMIDVLEHIPQPAPVVAALRNLLAPGGVLVVKVPHGSMQRFKERIRLLSVRTPDAREAGNIGVMSRFIHVNHFTPGSLKRCLENAGFTPVKVKTSPPDFHQENVDRSVTEKLRALNRVFVYRAARMLPFGVNSPLSFNLLADAVNPR